MTPVETANVRDTCSNHRAPQAAPNTHVERGTSGGVAHQSGGSQRKTTGRGVRAPLAQKRPPTTPTTVPGSPTVGPHLHATDTQTQQPHGPASNDALAHFVCPEPRQESAAGRPPQHQPQPPQTKCWGHARTTEAARTGPRAKQTRVTRRPLRREERATVQGSPFGGGGMPGLCLVAG